MTRTLSYILLPTIFLPEPTHNSLFHLNYRLTKSKSFTFQQHPGETLRMLWENGFHFKFFAIVLKDLGDLKENES